MSKTPIYRIEIWPPGAPASQVQFIESAKVVFGRSEEAQYFVKHNGVSRHHAQLAFDGITLTLEDLGSSNGTWVNGISIAPHSKTKIMPNDSIQLGKWDHQVRVSVAELLSQEEVEAKITLQEAQKKAIDMEAEARGRITEQARQAAEAQYPSFLAEFRGVALKQAELEAKGYFEKAKSEIQLEKQNFIEKFQKQLKEEEAQFILKLQEKHQKEITALNNELYQLRKILDSSKVQLKELEEKKSVVHLDCQALNNSHNELLNEIAVLNAKKEKMGFELSEFENQKEALIKDLSAEGSSLEAEIEALKNELKNLRKQGLEVQAHLSMQKDLFGVETEKLQKLQSKNLDMESLHLSRMLELDEIQSTKIKSLESDYQSKRSALENALAQKIKAQDERTALIEAKTEDKLKELRSQFENEKAKNSALLQGLASQYEEEQKTWSAKIQSLRSRQQNLFEKLEKETERKRIEAQSQWEQEAAKEKLRRQSEHQNELVRLAAETTLAQSQFEQRKTSLNGEILALEAKLQAEMEVLRLAHLSEIQASKQNMARLLQMDEEHLSTTREQLRRETEISEKKLNSIYQSYQTKEAELAAQYEVQKMKFAQELEGLKAEIESKEKELEKNRLHLDQLLSEQQEEYRAQAKALQQKFSADEQALSEKMLALQKELETQVLSVEEELQNKHRLLETEKAKALEELNLEIQTLRSKAAREIAETRKKFSLRMKEKEKLEKQTLAKFQLRERERIRVELEQEEKSIKERAKALVLPLSQNLSHQVSLKIGEILSAEDHRPLLKELEMSFEKQIRVSLLGQSQDVQDRSKEILNVDLTAQAQMRQWWKSRALYAGGATLALSLFFYFKQNIHDFGSQVMSSEHKNLAAEAYLKKARDHAALRYSPKTTEDFKETYTKNVLYTTDYVNTLMSQAYQDEWILKANDFFVKELGLGDNTIVQFIAQEANLIKKLNEIKEGIHPDHTQAGIEEMVREEEMVTTQMKITLEGEKRFRKFKEFSRQFYEIFRKQHQTSKE